MVDEQSEQREEGKSESLFLRLSAGYYGLWIVLLLILISKMYLIRSPGEVNLVGIGVYGIGMLVLSYLGAWLAWKISGRQQRIGEFTYLGIMTVLFLIRTVMIYREALA